MRFRRRRRSNDGFSLVEVLVAVSILAVALTSLAQLFVLATGANANARVTTEAAVAARQKMEQLRALAWSVDPLGLPVTEPGLQPSPAGALSKDVPGYCDYLDGRGRSLGTGGSPPPGTVVVRRWSIEPLPGFGNDIIVVQVVAGFRRSAASGDSSALGNSVRLVAVRTRKGM
ncbi:MAG: type IV pilus modification PilV family protein [Betaproteobacteria bacterium]